MITQIKLQITQIFCIVLSWLQKSEVRSQKSEKAVLCLLFSVFCFLSSVFCPLSSVLCQVSQEEFIYDPEGRRDPFIPLLERGAPRGLRTTFTPPEKQAKLPLEISVKGILRKGKEYYAIINDEVMRKGENIGAVKIKEIEKDKVILEYDEREFTIFLRKEKEK